MSLEVAHAFIFARRQASSPLIKVLEGALRKAGLEPRWLVPASKDGIAPSPVYVIWDDEAAWVNEMATTIRQTPHAAIASGAIFWVCEQTNTSWLDPQIDDRIYGRERERWLVDRFAVRAKQAVARAAHLARALENAKSETILRQREEFLGVCAHDLRSPIGLIRSSLRLALKETLTDLQRELLARAERQSTNALALVDDLLDVMSYEQGLRPQYEMVNLGGFLHEFERDYRLQAEQKQIHVVYESHVADWNVLIDPDRIRQLLQNIFTNAVKFTPQGKKIFIATEPFHGRRKTDPPYPMVIISIRDEGCGIVDKDMKEIFNRFAQGRSGRAEGRGLGLSVAKQIAQLHDGNVWAHSQMGKGTTFYVLLPYVVGPRAASNTARILVVEPSAERRELFAKSTDTHQIAFAKDGVEAVTLAAHLSPQIIFFAAQLDKLGPNEAARILKEAHHPAKRILMSDNDEPGYDRSLFDTVVTFPPNLDRLVLSKAKPV